MKIHNVILAVKSQLPLKRLLRNFFVTKNAWGMFHKKSHTKQDGTEKVKYSNLESAQKAANSMMKKYPDKVFSPYKCVYCDFYHIGKNQTQSTVDNVTDNS